LLAADIPMGTGRPAPHEGVFIGRQPVRAWTAASGVVQPCPPSEIEGDLG
jgi:hypothetical protein